ncbi:MAG: hypothetical protein WC551_14695, partial [Patescibacteria group bacterium]
IPEKIDIIEAGMKKEVEATFVPDADSDIGEYTLRMLVKGELGSEQYESPLRSVTIKIEAKANLMGNMMIIGLLVFIMAAIGGLSLWVARR